MCSNIFLTSKGLFLMHWGNRRFLHSGRIFTFGNISMKLNVISTSISVRFISRHSNSLHWHCGYGPLARYPKLWVAHAPGMPGTFSPPLQVSDSDMHHGTCVTHVPWCMPGSLTSGFLWNRWRGKYSQHSRRMRNPQFYVSGKRPMVRWPHCQWCRFEENE